mgnify:CR=1 FL=1
MGESNFGVFLKPLLIIALIVGLFTYAFVQSNALETRNETEIRNGFPYKVTYYDVHWERLYLYLKETPRRVKSAFSGK